MRETNEQIRAEIICTQGDTCEGCPFYGFDECDNLRGNGFDMYKDLLESRELIDKQGELIKEMREVLSSNLRDMDKIDHVCSMAGVHPYAIMRSEISAILEKTKEYAE